MKDRIMFFESEHVYYYNEKKVPSATRIIKRMSKAFDGDYWATFKAIKDVFPEEMAIEKGKHMDGAKCKVKPFKTVEYSDLILNPILEANPGKVAEYFKKRAEYLAAWNYKRDIASFRGTRFHVEQERLDREQGGRINPWTGKFAKHVNSKMDLSECDNYSLVEDLADLEDGYYTELLLFDHDLNYCGQADMVWIESGRKYRYFYIDDHKTNEEKPKKSAPNRYYSPLSAMYASKHNNYMMQSNLYAHTLVRAGYRCKGLAYTWYDGYDSKKSIREEFKYDPKLMKKVCENFL